MGPDTQALAFDAALLAREGALDTMSRRWSALAHWAAVAFVALIYSNPMYWWPVFEKFRLAFVSMAVAAAAVIAHRLSSGERVRTGGAPSVLLLAFVGFVPFSYLWTIDRSATLFSTSEALKLGLAYVAIQNALDTPRRLRRFLLVAALASLGPALGGIDLWRSGEGLVDGVRTRWRGLYADPNRLAMSLVAVLPFALYGFYSARRRLARALFAGTAAAQVGAIVLTHSRSGAIAAAFASLLFLLRGRSAARGLLAAGAVLVGVAILAPSSFWQRQATIADYQEDASVAGREAAWKVLGVIVHERPLTGVGSGAFLSAWSRFAPLESGGHRYVAHNVLLEIVGDLGIVAFGIFVAFVAWLLVRLWRAGRDPLVGAEARAILAGLAGYLVCEMANGYTLSWFLFFLFACAAAVLHLARLRAALGAEAEAGAP
jgi:O-antigen ligase